MVVSSRTERQVAHISLIVLRGKRYKRLVLS